MLLFCLSRTYSLLKANRAFRESVRMVRDSFERLSGRSGRSVSLTVGARMRLREKRLEKGWRGL